MKVDDLGPLTNLGLLTKLEYEERKTKEIVELVWPLKDAPVLAYSEHGRLRIVYVDRVVRPSSRAERREYRRTHWGLDGDGVVRDGFIVSLPLRTIGRSTSIAYTTRKGGDGDELVDYVHRWGDGARGKWSAPDVLEHSMLCRRGPRCQSRGGLQIVGGTYRVKAHGIVG